MNTDLNERLKQYQKNYCASFTLVFSLTTGIINY